MSQLSLRIVSCLPYSADNFVLHEGVRDAFHGCYAVAAGRGPSIVWVYGAQRSGKTHFSVKLYAELAQRSFFPNLIEGKDLRQFLSSRGVSGPFSRDEVFLIDSADDYFDALGEDSGQLVSFLETARMSAAPVVIFSARTRNSLPCDEHVMSRLRAGHLVSLLPPADNDMPQLISVMARQRGILLTAKRVGYIAKRLQRDVGAAAAYLDRVTELTRTTTQAVKMPLLSDAF